MFFCTYEINYGYAAILHFLINFLCPYYLHAFYHFSTDFRRYREQVNTINLLFQFTFLIERSTSIVTHIRSNCVYAESGFPTFFLYFLVPVRCTLIQKRTYIHSKVKRKKGRTEVAVGRECYLYLQLCSHENAQRRRIRQGCLDELRLLGRVFCLQAMIVGRQTSLFYQYRRSQTRWLCISYHLVIRSQYFFFFVTCL